MDQKRLFLAIAISVAILLGFQLLVPHPPLPPPQPATTEHAQGGQTEAGKTEGSLTQGGQAVPAAGGPGSLAQANAVPKNVPRVKIDAPRVVGSISLLGARIDDLVLKDYRETLGTELAAGAAAGAARRIRSRITCSMAGPRRPGRRSSCRATTPYGRPRRRRLAPARR